LVPVKVFTLLLEQMNVTALMRHAIILGKCPLPLGMR